MRGLMLVRVRGVTIAWFTDTGLKPLSSVVAMMKGLPAVRTGAGSGHGLQFLLQFVGIVRKGRQFFFVQYQRCAVGGRIGADAVGLVLYVHYLGFRLNDKLRVQLSCAGNFDI